MSKTLRKARKQNRAKRHCRTFAGYIGLIDGRPDVEMWPNREGFRTIHVILSERKARKVYEDVALVTITGVWAAQKDTHD